MDDRRGGIHRAARGHQFGDARIALQGNELGQGDRGEDAEYGDDDHQLDQGEAACCRTEVERGFHGRSGYSFG